MSHRRQMPHRGILTYSKALRGAIRGRVGKEPHNHKFETIKMNNVEIFENPLEEIPDSVIDSLARCLFPKLLDYFQSPEGQAEFESWKQQQNSGT